MCEDVANLDTRNISNRDSELAAWLKDQYSNCFDFLFDNNIRETNLLGYVNSIALLFMNNDGKEVLCKFNDRLDGLQLEGLSHGSSMILLHLHLSLLEREFQYLRVSSLSTDGPSDSLSVLLGRAKKICQKTLQFDFSNNKLAYILVMYIEYRIFCIEISSNRVRMSLSEMTDSLNQAWSKYLNVMDKFLAYFILNCGTTNSATEIFSISRHLFVHYFGFFPENRDDLVNLKPVLGNSLGIIFLEMVMPLVFFFVMNMWWLLVCFCYDV